MLGLDAGTARKKRGSLRGWLFAKRSGSRLKNYLFLFTLTIFSFLFYKNSFFKFLQQQCVLAKLIALGP